MGTVPEGCIAFHGPHEIIAKFRRVMNMPNGPELRGETDTYAMFRTLPDQDLFAEMKGWIADWGISMILPGEYFPSIVGDKK